MKKSLLLFFIFLNVYDSIACTTFFINKNGQMVFGRNYDWVTGNGMICTNQRGVSKTSPQTKDGATISWISAYGSLTFNQYGKEFPTGGMNEKGLVVELMWLDGTTYPAPDKRPAIGVLQWVQYQLDNCSTIEEVIATDKTIRIATEGSTPLHYLIADANGNAATIEFLHGKMLVHKGGELPFPVLTNNWYSESLSTTKPASGETPAFRDNSLQRFAQACSMLKNYEKETAHKPVVDYSFEMLDKVSQGSHTKWSIVYDITNRKIYFKTLAFSEVKEIAFSAFDLSCARTSRSWNMNQPGKGVVSNLFMDFSGELNRKLVERSFAESSSEVKANDEEIRQTWQYAGSVFCSK